VIRPFRETDVLWEGCFVGKNVLWEGRFVFKTFSGRTFWNKGRYVAGRSVLAPYQLIMC
jgi:hypothetical protein